MKSQRMFKYTMGGAPRLLNFKPSRGALGAMQAGFRPTRSLYRVEDHGERELVARAIAYAERMLCQRGVTIPAHDRTRIEFDYLDSDCGLPWTQRRRVRAVHWTKGGERAQYETRGTKRPRQYFTGYAWVEDSIVLTFPIPHWDFVPTVTEILPLAIAA